MDKKRVIIFLAIAVMLIATIACDFSFNNDDSPSEEEIANRLTLQAIQQTQTAEAKTPEPEDPPPPAESDSDDDTDDDDQQASNENCYFSKWTGDETILDGTKFDPGDSFVKSWTLRNEGTCEWTTDFRMVFEDGDQMGGSSSVYLTHNVSSGGTYTVEIPMTAPSSDGDYTGVWRFKAADGTKMGKYWVKITVGDPAPPPAAFAVTSVTYSMADTTIEITCPSNEVANITANITTSAGGVVSYKWDDNQGCLSGCPTKSMNFAGAETKSITHSMTIGAAGDYWAKIYIDQPNHQWFDQKNFQAFCNP